MLNPGCNSTAKLDVTRRVPRMGSWVPGTPLFSLKMQDFASFLENFLGGGPPKPPPPLEGHRRMRLVTSPCGFTSCDQLRRGCPLQSRTRGTTYLCGVRILHTTLNSAEARMSHLCRLAPCGLPVRGQRTAFILTQTPCTKSTVVYWEKEKNQFECSFCEAKRTKVRTFRIFLSALIVLL